MLAMQGWGGVRKLTDSDFGGIMNLLDALKGRIPIRATEIGGCPQTSDSILLSIRIVDHDIRRIIGLDLCSQIRMNFNQMSDILGFNSEQQRPKPLETSKVAANPEEVDFMQSGLLLRVV